MKVILNIPHCSTYIPSEERGRILLNNEELQNELRMSTDHVADTLFAFCNQEEIIKHKAKVSRVICDTERFEGIDLEPMEALNRGIVYWDSMKGKQLRQLDMAYRKYIVDKYYKPYHAELEHITGKSIKEQGKAFIIDCHSFNKHAISTNGIVKELPDVCIGTNENTHESTLSVILDELKNVELTVMLNKPFAGNMIPLKYMGDSRVDGVMIEVNQDILLTQSKVYLLRLALMRALKVISNTSS